MTAWADLVRHLHDMYCYNMRFELTDGERHLPNFLLTSFFLFRKIIPIGIICTALGLSLCFVAAFVFFHAYCIAYEGDYGSAEVKKNKNRFCFSDSLISLHKRMPMLNLEKAINF